MIFVESMVLKTMRATYLNVSRNSLLHNFSPQFLNHSSTTTATAGQQRNQRGYIQQEAFPPHLDTRGLLGGRENSLSGPNITTQQINGLNRTAK